MEKEISLQTMEEDICKEDDENNSDQESENSDDGAIAKASSKVPPRRMSMISPLNRGSKVFAQKFDDIFLSEMKQIILTFPIPPTSSPHVQTNLHRSNSNGWGSIFTSIWSNGSKNEVNITDFV
jgi:hypothetical protein